MKPAVSRTVSRIIPINAKNAALLRLMLAVYVSEAAEKVRRKHGEPPMNADQTILFDPCSSVFIGGHWFFHQTPKTASLP
jgi:hypothetical protein